MTTIAYKDGILAADSQVQQDGLVVDYTKKIWEIESKGVVVGGAGDLSTIIKIGIYINEVPCDFPSMDFTLLTLKDDAFNCIIVHGDDVYTLDSGLTPLKVTKKVLAIGTGAHIALGAMHSGASAEQAVKIACELDLYSGGAVRVIPIRNEEGNKND